MRAPSHQTPEDLRARIDALEIALAALRTDHAALAREVRRLRGGSLLRDRRDTPAEAAPRVMRPVDYWVEHLPDFGDGVTREEAERYLARPRVRPEDVKLTEEERAWRPSRPRSTPRPRGAPSGAPIPPAAGPSPLLWLLLGTILVLIMFVLVHRLFFW